MDSRAAMLILDLQDYGNMPMNYVGKQVENEISNLPPNTKMRFNAPLNQLWFITNSQWVLIYDCETQTFFQRYFNSDVVDMVGNYIVKRTKLCKLSDNRSVMTDDGEPLEYRARFKTESTLQDLLVKKVELDIMPLVDFYADAAAHVKVGKITVPFPDRTITSDGNRQRVVGVTGEAKEPRYSWLDSQDVFLNEERMYHGTSLRFKKRQVCRDHMIEVKLTGSGFPFVLNFISYDRAEV